MENMWYLVKFMMKIPINLSRILKNWDQDLANPQQRSELHNAKSILLTNKYVNNIQLDESIKSFFMRHRGFFTFTQDIFMHEQD